MFLSSLISLFAFQVLLGIFKLFRNYVNSFSYWKTLGITYLLPLPVFGNSFKNALALEANHKTQTKIYKKASNLKYVGTYEMSEPNLFVKDLTLINKILVGNFTNFSSRGLGHPNNPLFVNLVNMDGQEWHFLRGQLSPVLSSFNMNNMSRYVKECCDNLVTYMNAEYVRTGKPFEAWEVMARFTTDTISVCLFGTSEKALVNPDSKLHKMGQNIFTPTYKYKMKLLLRSLFPNIYRLFNFNNNNILTFLRFLKSIIKFNEGKMNILRVLLRLEKSKADIETGKTNLTREEIKHDQNIRCMKEKFLESNSYALFVAGYITTSLTLSYCLYSLADKQSVQDKLYSEIKNVLNNKGQLTYEALKACSYIDQVIMETLRLYPPALFLQRKCTADFAIDDDHVIKQGTKITIPVYSIHHDPQYFENAEEFIPERFEEQNRLKIRRGAYLPFGDGHRMCIGRQLAMLEMKMALSLMVLNFKFFRNPRTPSPLDFSKKTYLLVPSNGIWLDVKYR